MTQIQNVGYVFLGDMDLNRLFLLNIKPNYQLNKIQYFTHFQYFHNTEINTEYVYCCFENTNLPVDITILDGTTEELSDDELLISELREAEDVEDTTGMHFSCFLKKE